jgi:nucleoside phosphorylase
MDPVDVLILTALDDELEAVLELGEGGKGGWQEPRGRSVFPTYRRELATEGERPLHVAAGWTGRMGEVAAAARAEQLRLALDPACIAMCGICGGNRRDVFLGDVIIADRVFSYDAGKQIAAADHREASFLPDVETYNLDSAWRMHAVQLARELSTNPPLAAQRPPSAVAQTRWIMHTLRAAQHGEGPMPLQHPERAARCPDWPALIKRLIHDRLIAVAGGALQLTEQGEDHVALEQMIQPDAADPPFRVHVGPLATGKPVVQDPALFERLHQICRKTLGVDMEAAAIGQVAQDHGIPFLVVKAVSDYADHEKDDGFRTFACRASAAVLLTFLRRHLEPSAASRAHPQHRVRTLPRRAPAPDPPRYANERARTLSEALEETWQRRQTLLQRGGRTDEVDRDIQSLRGQLREGGLQPGASLAGDRYTLLERLGRGLFATVWKAWDCVEETHVAIKVLRRDGEEPIRRERFFEGAKRMAELESSAVVPVLDPRGEDEGYEFFVMELMEGGDLHDAVQAGRVRADDMLPIVLHIGGALAQAHAAGLVHRDVKPTNILLDRSGAPRLGDFDLVRAPDGRGRTETGGLGTYLYAAPEQLRSAREVTPSADVYGLGMTAIFILHGAELPEEALYEREAFITSLPCEDAVKTVLRRAVAARTAQRLASVDDLCAGLLRASGRGAETARQLDRVLSWSDGADAVRVAIRVADAYVTLADPEGARRAIERGLAFDARNAELRRRLRSVYERQGAWSALSAMIAEDAANAAEPEDRRRLYLEAAERRSASPGDLREAIELLFKSGEFSPATCFVLPFLREAVGVLGRSGETFAVLRGIVASGAGDGSTELLDLRLRLAAAYLERGEEDRAAVEVRVAYASEAGVQERARAAFPAVAALLDRMGPHGLDTGPVATPPELGGAQQPAPDASPSIPRDFVMSFINYAAREIHLKILYVGADGAGVSSNVDYVYERTKPEWKGPLLRFATQERQARMFDFKAPPLGEIRGFGFRFHLYSIPNGSFNEQPRRTLLKSPAGIVFVADSRADATERNLYCLERLRGWLDDMHYPFDRIPLVIQYNRRDMPDILSVEELRARLNPFSVPDFEGVARTGVGVFDTLKTVAKQAIAVIRSR